MKRSAEYVIEAFKYARMPPPTLPTSDKILANAGYHLLFETENALRQIYKAYLASRGEEVADETKILVDAWMKSRNREIKRAYRPPRNSRYIENKIDVVVFAPQALNREKLDWVFKKNIKIAKANRQTEIVRDLEENLELLKRGRLKTGKKRKNQGLDEYEGFMRELKALKRVRLSRKGSTKFHIEEGLGIIHLKEKGVDADLIIQVMEDLFSEQTMDMVVIITNDSDFCPLIEKVRERGSVPFVASIDPTKVSREMKDALGADGLILDLSRSTTWTLWDNLFDHIDVFENYDLGRFDLEG